MLKLGVKGKLEIHFIQKKLLIFKTFHWRIDNFFDDKTEKEKKTQTSCLVNIIVL